VLVAVRVARRLVVGPALSDAVRVERVAVRGDGEQEQPHADEGRGHEDAVERGGGRVVVRGEADDDGGEEGREDDVDAGFGEPRVLAEVLDAGLYRRDGFV